jgi:hypothetical protein
MYCRSRSASMPNRCETACALHGPTTTPTTPMHHMLHPGPAPKRPCGDHMHHGHDNNQRYHNCDHPHSFQRHIPAARSSCLVRYIYSRPSRVPSNQCGSCASGQRCFTLPLHLPGSYRCPGCQPYMHSDRIYPGQTDDYRQVHIFCEGVHNNWRKVKWKILLPLS